MELPGGFTSYEQYSFPTILNVCIFKGSCSANCIHCPLGKTEPRKRKHAFGAGSMDMKLFRKIADEVGRYQHAALRLHAVGEPTMWRRLPEAVTYAHEKGVKTWIFTNAITGNKRLLETVTGQCNIVEVSVNSYDEEDYRSTKGVDAYPRVRANIEYMADYIARRNLKTRLLLSRVESRDKEYDAGFLSYWKSRNVAADVFIRSYHSYNSIIEDKLQRGKVTACNVHWSRFNINTDGDAVICFNELFRGAAVDTSLVLGNVVDNTIQSIWQGERLTAIRESQFADRPHLITFTKNLPCLDCKYCQPLGSNTPKSECQLSRLC